MKDELVQTAIDNFFLTSKDFNGIALPKLLNGFENDEAALRHTLTRLVHAGTISLQYGINPHIIRTSHYTADEQLDLLANQPFSSACAYPTEDRMLSIRVLDPLLGKPYSQKLALASPQLQLAYFEMDVLERYINDPRYRFDMDDYDGFISIGDDFAEDNSVAERDRVFLQSFGIGYRSSDRKRLVCVYLCYLNRLTPEHQAHWNGREVNDECVPFPTYYANTALGEWDSCISMFTSFLQEQKLINELSVHLYGKALFRRDFLDDRPREFMYLLAPTAKHFNVFIHVLDKLLAENLDKAFFEDRVRTMEREIEIVPGKVRIETKGTIALLDEWLKPMFRDEPNYEVAMIAPLRYVRRMRQQPAHSLSPNIYNTALLDQQTRLMEEVLTALINIRHHLQRHPLAKDLATPNWYRTCKTIKI